MTDAVTLRHLKALGAKRVPKPIEFPRPNAKPKVRRKATADDLKKMFGGTVRYVPRGEVSADA